MTGWRISKDFAFSASHQLNGLRDGHPCGRLHGHNYVVRVELEGEELDDHGFVLDYGELKAFGNYIDTAVDHRHLNDLKPAPVNPTAELLAREFWQVVVLFIPTEELPRIRTVRVSVSETPKTWATFEDDLR